MGDTEPTAIKSALESRGIRVEGNMAIVNEEKKFLHVERVSPGTYYLRSRNNMTVPLALVPVLVELFRKRLSKYRISISTHRYIVILNTLLGISFISALAGFFINEIIVHVALAVSLVSFAAMHFFFKHGYKVPSKSLLGRGEEREFPVAIFSQNDSATMGRIVESMERYSRTGDMWWLKNAAWLSWAISMAAGIEADPPPENADAVVYVAYIAEHGMEESDRVPVFIPCPICGTKIEMIPRSLAMAAGADGLFRYISNHGNHTLVVELDRDLHVRNVSVAHGQEEVKKVEDIAEEIRRLRQELGDAS